jgi:hypothetical protein
MTKPVGYWVQQVGANGETVVVKVMHVPATGQLALGMSDAPHNVSDAPKAEG